MKTYCCLEQITTHIKEEYDKRTEWNLTELQQAINKEVRVFEAELITGHPAYSSHPTVAFHASICNQQSYRTA